MKLHLDKELFNDLIESTSKTLSMPAIYVEKDYWVTYILKRLSKSKYSETAIFKGGTSLSKAYKLIYRFSEDIDLAIISKGKSGSQIKALIKEIEKGILDDNFHEIVTSQTSKGSQFRKTVHQYPKIIEGDFGHANENLILELNTFAQPHPYVNKTVSSYIYDFLNTQSDDAKELIEQFILEPFEINVLDYKRTFCEKISAVGRASFENDEENTQLKEKIRHFYDIYYLMQENEIKTFLNSSDFENMIQNVRTDDQHQFSEDWANVKLHSTTIFNDLDMLDSLDSYYKTNFNTLVYSNLPEMNDIKMKFIELAKELKRKIYNMGKIEQSLDSLFQEHRIIIWYDEGGSLENEFNSINLDVKKLTLDNNEFGIKVKVLYEDKSSKYLIYSPNAEPENENNWLLDIEHSFHKFNADPISMIVSELELDITKKAFISEHKAFFNAKNRFDKYKSVLSEKDSDEELVNKMISVLINCEETIEEILFKLIANEDLTKELNKYNLSEKLLKQLEEKYNYKSKTLSISDLTYKLLQNHFYSTINSTTKANEFKLNREAILFVKHWIDSNRHKELFKNVSYKVQKDLNIQSVISNYDLAEIVDCDTYEVCEQYIISKLRDLIVNAKINEKELETYLNKREHKFWYDKYENIYKTFNYAIKLYFGINNFKADISSFEDGINKYNTFWYEIDYNYRKFVYYFNNSEHKEIVKQLSILEDAYLNSYLRILNDKWQNYVKDYSINLPNHQRDFYKSKVSPIIEKKQKAFVIISDALRYECGKELAKLISYENTENRSFIVKENHMICSLPSYTQLGMASLLPNKELEIKSTDDTVYVDGKTSKGKEARTKILQNTNPNSIALNDEEFLLLNRNDGRDLVKSNDVVYIYHNDIDTTGDDSISEEKVFDAVERTFKQLTKIVKQIANLNGTNIFITSDHGFIYTNKQTEDSEFCKLDTTFLETSKVNRRFVIGKDLQENSCTQKFTSEELGINGDNDFLITKSINKIRKQGGGNRFVHGGAALQELVIPLLEIKYHRKNVISEVEATIMPISTITTNNVNVSVYQEEPISEKVKPITLVCGFYGEDGKELSDKHKITLDSNDNENRNRENKLRFTFKEISNKYSGQFIRFTMKKVIENSSELPIYKTFDVKLQLSFFNDFDEF